MIDAFDAKEHLDGIQTLHRLIKTEWLEYYELREKAKGISTYMGGNERVQTSLNVDKVANMAIKLLEKERKVIKLLAEFQAEKKEARKRLEYLKKSKEIDVLEKVYFEDYTFTRYAEEKGMTFRGVYYLYKRALENVSEIYKNYEKL